MPREIMSEQASTYQAFVDLNKSQLANIPSSLWKTLYTKLQSNSFSAEAFDISISSSTKRSAIVSTLNIPKYSDIYLFPHVWTFRSQLEARTHLDSSPELRRSITRTIHLLDAIEDFATAIQDNEAEEFSTGTILSVLYRIAYQYQLTAPSPQANNGLVTTNYYYVTTDPFSPSFIPFSTTNSSLACTVFIDAQKARALTLTYPIRDIEKDEELTRLEMTPMPDYSSTLYWEHHYKSSSQTGFEWFVGWDSLSGIVKKAIGEKIGKGLCLNLGCGLSGTGTQMVEDMTIGAVLNVDVSFSAVDRLKKENNANLLQEFVCLDATKLPIRNGTIDLVFDKGTLDGILYHTKGIEMAKAMWGEAARVLGKSGVLVLVSLGLPDSRVQLIEEQLKWEVVDAFEVEDKRGIGKNFEGAVSNGRIEKCFVYICKKP